MRSLLLPADSLTNFPLFEHVLFSVKPDIIWKKCPWCTRQYGWSSFGSSSSVTQLWICHCYVPTKLLQWQLRFMMDSLTTAISIILVKRHNYHFFSLMAKIYFIRSQSWWSTPQMYSLWRTIILLTNNTWCFLSLIHQKIEFMNPIQSNFVTMVTTLL